MTGGKSCPRGMGGFLKISVGRDRFARSVRQSAGKGESENDLRRNSQGDVGYPRMAQSRAGARARRPEIGEYDEELHETAQVYLDRKRREDTAEETTDRKEGETMTQKERYRRTREAMRMALRHIDAKEPDIEDCLREVVDAVSAELPEIEGAAAREEEKECVELTQEKYKKVAAAMRRALMGVCGDFADVEDRPRTADAEKLETEDEAKKLTRAAVLEKARACVCGEREEDYGSPEDSFGCIAELWETYLRAACVSPDAIVTVTPTDVAMMMALLKISRVGTSFVGGTADSFVDLAGYAACGAECAEVTV